MLGAALMESRGRVVRRLEELDRAIADGSIAAELAADARATFEQQLAVFDAEEALAGLQGQERWDAEARLVETMEAGGPEATEDERVRLAEANRRHQEDLERQHQQLRDNYARLRELETLRWIARGLSNQEIACTLVVHERTIAKYVSSVLNKLHLANRTQAALYAIREGLTTVMAQAQ